MATSWDVDVTEKVMNEEAESHKLSLRTVWATFCIFRGQTRISYAQIDTTTHRRDVIPIDGNGQGRRRRKIVRGIVPCRQGVRPCGQTLESERDGLTISIRRHGLADHLLAHARRGALLNELVACALEVCTRGGQAEGDAARGVRLRTARADGPGRPVGIFEEAQA